MALLNARMSIRKGIRDTMKKAQLARESASLPGKCMPNATGKPKMLGYDVRLNFDGKHGGTARSQTMVFLPRQMRVAGKFDAKAGGSDRIKVKKMG